MECGSTVVKSTRSSSVRPEHPPRAAHPMPTAQPTVIIKRSDDWDDDDYKKVKYDKYGRPYKKSKTKSMLGELFDF